MPVKARRTFGSSHIACYIQGTPAQKEPISVKIPPLFRSLLQKIFLLHAFRELPGSREEGKAHGNRNRLQPMPGG